MYLLRGHDENSSILLSGLGEDMDKKKSIGEIANLESI